MIEIIGVTNPLTERAVLRDMLIPAADGDFASEALDLASAGVDRMTDEYHVAAQAWGVDPKLLRDDMLLYRSLVIANGQPTLSDLERHTIESRASAYRDASVRITEITSANQAVYVPDAQVVYGGLMFGIGEMVRAKGTRLLFRKWFANRLMGDYYQHLDHVALDDDHFRTFRKTMADRLSDPEPYVVDLSNYH